MCKFEIYVYLCIRSFNLNFRYMATRKQHTYIHTIRNAITLVWGSLRLAPISPQAAAIVHSNY